MVRGATHISLTTQEYDRGNGENRRTNEQTKLGVNQEQRKVCNTTCMCRLSLAWVTSENSTMILESVSSWLTLAGPYPMLPLLSAPVSGVDSPVRSSTPTSAVRLPAVQPPTSSLLSSRQIPSLLSSRQLPSPGSPAANCPLLGRVVNSHSRPLTTSGYGEISCPRILVWFRAKTEPSAWRPTHIVLHRLCHQSQSLKESRPYLLLTNCIFTFRNFSLLAFTWIVVFFFVSFFLLFNKRILLLILLIQIQQFRVLFSRGSIVFVEGFVFEWGLAS